MYFDWRIVSNFHKEIKRLIIIILLLKLCERFHFSKICLKNERYKSLDGKGEIEKPKDDDVRLGAKSGEAQEKVIGNEVESSLSSEALLYFKMDDVRNSQLKEENSSKWMRSLN